VQSVGASDWRTVGDFVYPQSCGRIEFSQHLQHSLTSDQVLPR